VGRGDMEIEIREGEGEQEILHREGKLMLSEMEDDVLAGAAIHRFGRDIPELLLRFLDHTLQIAVAPGAGVLRRTEFALPDAFDGARRVMSDGRDLEAEGKHVASQARLHDLVGVGAFLLAEFEALPEKARSAAKR